MSTRPSTLLLAAAALLLGMGAGAHAQSTLYVDALGAPGTYATIQGAIDAAVSGDTILVAPGLYLETIDFLGKDVAVLASGAGGADAHVIDAQGAPDSGPVVRFVSGEGPGAVLDGFTITGGVGVIPTSSGDGGVGGVLISASPTVRNCHIVGNVGGTVPNFGNGSGGVGGMLVTGGGPTIESCEFRENVGGDAKAPYSAAGGGSGGAGGLDFADNTNGYWAVSGCSFIDNVGGLGERKVQCSFFPPVSYCLGTPDDGPGALRILRVRTVVSDCSFTGNVGGGDAPGGIKVGVSAYWSQLNRADIRDCVFDGNVGGAVHVFEPDFNPGVGSPPSTITRCRMTANSGPTIYSGSGLDQSNMMSLEISQCTLVGNFGGPAISRPLELFFWGYGQILSVDGCVVVGHDPGTHQYGWDNGVLSGGASFLGFPVSNSIFWDNLGVITSPLSQPVPDSFVINASCVEGGFAGVGNIGADPLFVQAPSAGLDGLWGTADDDLGDLRLQPGSPCIDAGDNTLLAFGQHQDLDGKVRFHDEPATTDTGVPGALGGGAVVDMGSFEHGALPSGTWTDLGQGLGFPWYTPALAGSGSLQDAQPMTLMLVGGAPNATSFLVLGFSQVDVPLYQGVLVPFPDRILPLLLDGSGSISGTVAWPAGLPSGTTLYYQFWIPDAVGPQGFTASNGLASTTP